MDKHPDVWAVVDAFFKRDNILVNHQIGSYNNYFESTLPNIIGQYFPLNVNINDNVNQNTDNPSQNKIKKISLNIIDINVKRPVIHENNGSIKLMTPDEARLRGFTYSSPIYVKISINVDILENGNVISLPEKIINEILFGKIPIMVKSKYCILDDCKNTYLEMNECKYDHGGYFIIS